jgi:RNA polymerase sigma factor FliA
MPPSAGSSATADELVESHLHLVQHIVQQLASSYPRHVDRAELWSAGALGLVDASRRYDPATGIPFDRYAAIRIRGSIIDSTRSRDWASRRVRREVRAVREAGEAIQAATGRSASVEELATTLGLSEEEVRTRQAHAATATLLQLDAGLAGDEGAGPSTATLLEEDDPAYLPAVALEHEELVGTVRTAVRHLPEVHREVVVRSFFNGELMRDIADSLGVTEARVSQIRSESVLAMRAYFATGFEEVEAPPAAAPGGRRRAAYVAELAAHSTWRSRLDAAAAELVPNAV